MTALQPISELTSLPAHEDGLLDSTSLRSKRVADVDAWGNPLMLDPRHQFSE